MADTNVNARLKVLQPEENDSYVNPVTQSKAVYHGAKTVAQILDELSNKIQVLEDNQSAKINSTNLDNCLVPGKVYYYSGTENTPNTTYSKWVVWAFPGGDNTVVQYASAGNNVFFRTRTGNIWSKWTKVLSSNDVYPVNSLYLTLNDTNPGTFLGGTWEKIDEGYFLRAAGSTAGGTGGSNSLMLEIDNLPAHKHMFQKDDYTITWGTERNFNVWMNVLAYSGIQQAGNYVGAFQGMVNDGLGSRATSERIVGKDSSDNIVYPTQKAINNQPSFLNVYIWKRVN